MIARFSFGGRNDSDRFEQPAVIEPIDPFQGGEFDGFEVASWAASMDHLGFVETVDRLGQGVVGAVSDAADRRVQNSLDQPFGIFDRQKLNTPIAVMNQTVAPSRSTIVERCSKASRTKTAWAVREATSPRSVARRSRLPRGDQRTPPKSSLFQLHGSKPLAVGKAAKRS